MKVYFEVQPSRYRDKLAEQLESVRGVVDRVHVPDAPLGYPKASSIAIASLAIARGIKATAHLRTTDYSLVGFLNQVYGAHILGIDRLLLLRGDPPFAGTPVADVSPEDGLRIIRSDTRLRSMGVGLTLSLRHAWEKIAERLSLAPDFVLVTHRDLDKLSALKRVYRGEVVGYLVVETARNSSLVSSLPQKEDVCQEGRFRSCLDSLDGYVEAALVSCPGDPLRCAEILTRSL